MQFALLIFQGTTPLPNTPEWDRLDAEEQQAVYADYAALNSTPGLTPGLPLGLPADATTVRVARGSSVTEPGPVSVDHPLGGYFILEAEDLDAAIAVAARVPAARLGGAVEVRPMATYW